jgi:hypothetical protein
MKPVDEKVTRLSSEGLSLILGGRQYGESDGDYYDSRFKMDLPPKLLQLGQDLLSASRLQMLVPDAAYEDIYAAYGSDLNILTRCRKSLATCIEAAIRARASEADEDAQAFLSKLTEELKSFDYQPSLDLGAEALKLEPRILVPRLQLQFQVDVDALVRRTALWLHTLAERDHISVVEWFNPSALRYHFFRMDETHTDEGSKITKTGNFIDGVTTTTETKTRIITASERRVHTVVGAQVHRLEQYRGRVPERISRFINEIPRELREYVSIVDGNVTQEEIRRKDISDRVAVETRSVFQPDPAVLLFDTWALTGWGGSSNEQASSIYRGHPASRADRIFLASLTATVVATLSAMQLGGGRVGIMVGIFGAVMTIMSQIGMRIGK